MPGGPVAVVLAAGGGTRFAGPPHKLATRLRDGRTLAATSVGVALDAAVGPVLVVVGAVGAAALELPWAATAIVNERWADGQATSISCAIEWAGAHGHDALVVGLADQPGLTAEAWRAVAASTATSIAMATYGGRRAHPVRLAGAVWSALPTEGDEGARRLLRDRADLVTEVACTGDPGDIDTVADLDRWRAEQT